MNKNPFFTVIVPTCHRNDLLAKCLDCLAPSKQMLAAEHYEVIVSDDGSESTAEELVKQNYSWARWIVGPKRGPAANRNHGARLAQGNWLVFTDDDCLPDKGFIKGYRDAAMENNSPVLEGKTSPCGERSRVDMECPANETGGYLWSCNMAVKKNLFFELDGFDENFPGPAMEDVDFRTRLLKAGNKIKFVPQALVLHPWRSKKGLQHINLVNASILYFASKHSDQRGNFTVSKLLLALARRLCSHIPRAAIRCKGRGWLNESISTVYSTWTLYKTMKKIK